MPESVMHVMSAHVAVNGFETTQEIEWSFDKADPFAVTMAAPGQNDEKILWVFSRSILSEALINEESLAGTGDVTASANAIEVAVYLANLEGSATVITDRGEMQAFLDATYEIVPLDGGVSDFAEGIDNFLSDILGYTPAEVEDTTAVEPGPTKTLVFGDKSYTVPLNSPDDLAEWEADLLHGLYHQENNEDL